MNEIKGSSLVFRSLLMHLLNENISKFDRAPITGGRDVKEFRPERQMSSENQKISQTNFDSILQKLVLTYLYVVPVSWIDLQSPWANR